MSAIEPQDREAFAVDLLTQLPATVNADTERFLVNWMGLENTQAGNNPLATELYQVGSTDFNSVGVKNYPSRQVGLTATKETLLNGLYPNIVKALEDGDPFGAQAQGLLSAELSKWSGGGYHEVPGAATVHGPKRASVSLSLPYLKNGATGDAVELCQFLLSLSGHTVNVDGAFGPQTDSGVRGFQSNAGIAVDGIVGPDTWNHLLTPVTA